MSTPKKTAAKPAAKPANEATNAATPATKPERKAKAKPLPLAARFELMQSVKDADPTLPDAVLADALSVKFARTVAPATVTEYRKQFGLASVKKPTAAQLATYIDMLKVQIAGLGAVPVPFPTFTDADDSGSGEVIGAAGTNAEAGTEETTA